MKPVVVLVETMGPANIGSVARSAAAYGLDGFRMVAPRCELDESTLKWACYGKRLLNSIEYFPDLGSALEDTEVAVALSRREGRSRHRHHSLSTLVERVLPEHPPSGKVALVFGNEESGLALDHLKLYHYSAEIPVVAEDGSLNLAHAVSTVLFELLGRPLATDSGLAPKNEHEEKAPAHDLAVLAEHCRTTLERVGYPRHRSTLEEEMVKLGSIVSRSALEKWEVKLLLGMLRQINYRLDNPQ